MKRRQFITALGAAASTATLAKPAVAQSMPEVKWRLTSSFPKSLDILYGGAETLAKHVSEASDRKFQIQVFAAGEIVPGLQVLDAASSGTVEVGHTMAHYYFGKNSAFSLASAPPFGLNSRQQNAWFNDGGGNALVNALAGRYGAIAFPGGNTGARMGGWYRKEIASIDDLRGLKMRIGGQAGQVLAKLGVAPQQLAAADIYPALERGTLDAADWLGPYDDEKLGFSKVARYYYYPAWWAGATALHFFVNLDKWNALPEPFQAIFANAAAHANTDVQARYDSKNPSALKRILASGAQLRAFSQPVVEAGFKAANEVHAELSAANPDYKKMYDSMRDFRNDQYLWWQVAEYSFDTMSIRNRRL